MRLEIDGGHFVGEVGHRVEWHTVCCELGEEPFKEENKTNAKANIYFEPATQVLTVSSSCTPSC